jgi:geranylgeranylglycerol-phosphate geranylgeranyltransferase
MSKPKLSALCSLFRFELPAAAGLSTLVGALLALGELPGWREGVLGVLSVFLISASALILNDYFDLPVDRVNAPERPLPSGAVTPREALFLFGAVSALGLLAALALGPAVLAAAFLVWLLGILYSWRLKQTGLPGNLLVSLSVGATFLYGGLVAGKPFQPAVWYLAVLGALINLGEEIAADALDALGDQVVGSRSLALQLGREEALGISGTIFFAAVILSALPFSLGWLEWIYFLPVAAADLVIVYSAGRLNNRKTEEPRRYVRWIYLSASAAMLIFLVLQLVYS